MTSIIDIEGIGAVQAEKLKAVGIYNTDDLLEVAGPKAGRVALGIETGISEKLLLEWVNLADLMRIDGVGEEFSDLLEEAGVDSCPELAQRNADNLHAALVEINDRKNLVNRLPSRDMVADFIDQAASLPKVVTH